MGVAYEAVVSNFDEHLDDQRSPQEVAIELALGKAREVARRHPDAYVIGSDTIVTVNGKQLEKPKDKAEARAMLRRLSEAGDHEVTTSVVVINKAQGIELAGSDTTVVHFKPYDEAVVTAYVATDDPLDKAGAYGIQSGAAPLISHIKGEYDTIVGFPTKLAARLLGELGIEAHPVHVEAPVKQESR